MKKFLPLFLTLALLLSLAGSARFGVAAAEDTAAEPEMPAQTEESEAPAQTEEPEMPAQTVEQLDPPEEPAQTVEPEEASAMPWDAYVSLSEERLSVSTEELIDLIQESRCLESAAMYRVSDNDEVYGRLRERFNILAELETRPDAPLSLLKRYCKPGDNMFTLLDTSFYWNRLNETEQVIFARVYEAKTGRTYPRYEGGPVPEGLPEENDYLILPDGRLSRPGAKTVWEDGKIKVLPRGDDIIFVFTVEVETPAAHTELTDEQLHAPTGELVDALLTLAVVREMDGLFASVPWMDAEYHYAIAQALVPGIRELETRPDAASVLLRKLRDRLKPGELVEALCLKNLLSVEPYSSMLTQAEAAQYAQLVQTISETFYVSVDDAASDADVYDADEPVEPPEERNDYVVLPDGRLGEHWSFTEDEDGNAILDEKYQGALEVVQAETPPYEQLPQELLAAPTEELVEAILKHQVARDLTARVASSKYVEQHGYNVKRNRFNGLRELESRPDAVAALLNVLAEKLEAGETESADCLDLLLSMSGYAERFTASEAERFAQLHAAAREAYAAAHTVPTDETCSTLSDPQVVSENGFYYTKTATTQTTYGTIVPLYSARSDHSESDKLSLAVAIAQQYDVKRLGNATSKYN